MWPAAHGSWPVGLFPFPPLSAGLSIPFIGHMTQAQGS